jgi:hypothetical protein
VLRLRILKKVRNASEDEWRKLRRQRASNPNPRFKTQQKQGVCHTVALAFTLKSVLRQKKNYGNSNISPCKTIILKKNPLKETKILQEIITL